jgi:DNA-binding XRE family transcriptional regulator
MIAYKLSYVKTKIDKAEGVCMARIIDGNEMNLIGNSVRKYRKEAKMSQQMLSNKLELLGVYVCRGSISRIEDKSRTVTDIELYAIAKVLNIDIIKLFDTKK